MEELNDQLAKKKNQISNMMERTSEVRRMKEDLKQSLSMALKEKLELEREQERINRQIEKMVQQVELFERQIKDLHEQYAKNSQAEENEIEEKLRKIQVEVDEANINIQRLKEEEGVISQKIAMVEHEIEQISNQIQDVERSHHDMSSRIRELQMHQKNKVTAFGGGRVTYLLQAIERHQHEFSIPPIGPIGAHVKLEHGDMWGMAIENAVGRLLNAFIVTDHKDARILRGCAREANYNQVQVVMYDFRRPRLDIPRHMLPQTNHPTAFSVLNSDNPTVLNVLVDMGSAERQVLVKDYDVGRTVAFDQRIQNVKEVYTSDGYKMFCRGSAETILPPNKHTRAGRLSGSFDNQIKYLESDALEAKMKAQQGRGLKRAKEDELRGLKSMLDNVKRRRINMERQHRSKEFELHDVKKLLSPEANAASASTVDDLHQEIHKLQDEIREKEGLLANLQNRVNGAGTKAKDLKMSFENLCESAKSEIDALAVAENELMGIESDLNQAERDKNHYETIMHTKVLADLKNAEAAYGELEHSCQESRRKASIICPESEIETLGCNDESPEQLSSQLSRLTNRLQRESQRFPESIADLRMLCEKKERKISRKLQTYKAFREKLEACDKALNLRWSKFQRNATLLKRQLTWQFNGHLKKKGISGQIKVSYEEQDLSVEVKMPQDASTSSTVHDTKGLSGGERSFSTLCFALALHEMTEAPFRAMDEFDVFMDAVSRKISLDAIVDFALAQGSQWIFITPHDISMVKNDERVKKQQMAAPRG